MNQEFGKSCNEILNSPIGINIDETIIIGSKAEYNQMVKELGEAKAKEIINNQFIQEFFGVNTHDKKCQENEKLFDDCLRGLDND